MSVVSQLRVLQHEDVPAEWERQLAELSPPTDRLTWLKLLWEPGHPWETPVERYLLYEMMPASGMTTGLLAAILEQLQHGAPPSAMGNYYDTALEMFVRNPDCLITERAWHLYRETGCWGRPYWVIQGTQGGHKRWFSTVEKKLLKLHNLPSEPADPGDLPYAPFDERTIRALRTHDQLRDAEGRLTRSHALLGRAARTARLADEERAYRAELVAWLHAQTLDAAGDITRALKASTGNHSSRSARDMDEAAERAEAAFIETGRSDGVLIP